MTKRKTKQDEPEQKAMQLRTAAMQREFVAALPSCAWNVTMACERAGIGRATYYRWLQESEEFAEMVTEAKEQQKDFIETALMKEIREQNTACIIFACKTQLKDRGYIERTEVDQRSKIQIVFDQEDEGL